MDWAESDEIHEVGERFVLTRGDAAEVFELVEKPLDQIAFFVEVPIAGMWSAAVMSRRNDRHGAGIEDGIVEVLGIEGPPCATPMKVAEQDCALSSGAIVSATTPASRSAHRLSFEAHPERLWAGDSALDKTVHFYTN